MGVIGGSLGLILSLILFVLVTGHGLCHAGEPGKPVRSTAEAVGTAGGPTLTNQISLAVKLRPLQAEAPATVDRPATRPASGNPTLAKPKRAARHSIFDVFTSNEPNLELKGFQAGYGQAYDPESVSLRLRRRNGGTLEEPRYVFIKTCMKF